MCSDIQYNLVAIVLSVRTRVLIYSRMWWPLYCLSFLVYYDILSISLSPNSTVYQNACSYRQYNGHQILLYIRARVLTDSAMATKFYCISEHMFLQTVQWPSNFTVYQNTSSYLDYNLVAIVLSVRTCVLIYSIIWWPLYCL
jgi:hypothetical protein